MMKLTWIAADGEQWPLLGQPHKGVFVEHDSLEGGVGVWEDSTTTVPGRPGQLLSKQDMQVKPFELSITLVADNADAWKKFRAGLHPRREGVLQLSIGDRRQFEAKARVRSSMDLPAQLPKAGFRSQVVFVVDAGVWEYHQQASGQVTVDNWGDVTIWAEVEFEKPGVLTLPSGARIALPSPKGRWRLRLGREHGGTVVDQSGAKVARVPALGECTPVDAVRKYGVPDGAELTWKVGVLDPWAH